MNNWDRMRAGKFYNADSTDIAGYHEKGMGLCDKFNRTPIWMKKRKQRILEKMITSAKDGGAYIFAPFYCEYGVNKLFRCYPHFYEPNLFTLSDGFNPFIPRR